MMIEFAHFLSILAWVTSLLSVGLYLLPLSIMHHDSALILKRCSRITFMLLLFSFLILAYHFVISDFSVLLVFQHSGQDDPLLYRLTSIWGNHEGSFLLWILLFSLITALFSLARFKAEFMQKALFHQLLLLTLFLGYSLLTSNPFLRLDPAASQGQSLNPLLQDPAFAFHPPILYTGYAGFAFLFTCLLSALTCGFFSKPLMAWLRKLSLFFFAFLTFGIMLGSFWAYYELGWGGYWFWDPVENASLLVWISAAIFIHCLMIYYKKELFLNWTILMGSVTFLLSLLATFLVRSGLISSVHNFAQNSQKGLFLLMILFFYAFLCFCLFIKHMPQSSEEKEASFPAWSKPGFILIQNVGLIIILSLILLGTLYPLFLEFLIDEQITIGTPFYSKVLTPFVLCLSVLLGLVPLTSWGQKSHSFSSVYRVIISVLSVVIFSGALILFYAQQQHAMVLSLIPQFLIKLILIFSGLWLVCFSIYDYWVQKKPINKTYMSAFLAHLGIGFVVLSIGLSSLLSQEKDLVLSSVQPSSSFEGQHVSLLSLEAQKIDNYLSLQAHIQVDLPMSGSHTFTLERRRYEKLQIELAKTTLHMRPWSDYLFILSDIGADRITIRIIHHPFIFLLWLGGILISLASLVPTFYDLKSYLSPTQESTKKWEKQHAD